MRRVRIVTDSCSDLTPELMSRYDIGYARMNTVYQGRTSPADLSWRTDDTHVFYETLRDREKLTVSDVTADEFERVFRPRLTEGEDIVYIGCSGRLSGSVETARGIAKKLEREYPGSRIVCVDSRHISMGEGLLAMEASKFASNGTTADEVGQYASERSKAIRQFAAVRSLTTLKRAGKIRTSEAFFWNLFEIKPILTSNTDGEQRVFRKVRGREGSLSEIIRQLSLHIRNPEMQTVYWTHADCHPNTVKAFQAEIRRQIPCRDTYVCAMGPFAGAFFGPDAVSIWGGGEKNFSIPGRT